MSELITSPGTGLVFPEYNLTVTSEGSIVLSIPSDATVPTAIVTGSAFGEFIAPFDPNDTTVFNVAAGDGNDTVQGGASSDSVSGDAGDDVIDGGGANDNVLGGEGNDSLAGATGSDLLEGGTGNDSLAGGEDGDALLGGQGNDQVSGGQGNDSLQGGTGKDTLTGGSGQDEFRFEKGSTGGKNRRQADVVTDFSPKDDTIQMDRRLFRGVFPSGKLDKDNFLKVKSFNVLKNDVLSGKLPGDTLRNKIIYEANSGVVYYSRNTNETTVLVQLGKNLAITSNDFELFY